MEKSTPQDSKIKSLLSTDNLLKGGKDDLKTIPLNEALKDKDYILFYFSAHWCGPCRNFTPQLAEFYKTHAKDKKFEIVFVSSDRDEDSFKEYFGEEMPWLALPYDNRDAKNKLSRKFKVQGIPTLIVLDANGETICTNARGKVSQDSEAKEFPWTPKTFWQILDGEVIDGKGGKVKCEDLKKKEALGIYFSAHWCPPCRGFTPELVKTYNKLKEEKKGFEIVFASSDRDEESFKEYFGEMPWLAIPFGDKRKEELSDRFDVEGIPTLVIVDPSTGKTITTEGRSAVGADKEGKEFPWHPKPLNDINANPSPLNSEACLLLLIDKVGDDEKKKAKEALEKIATDWWDKWKDKDEKPLYFFYGEENLTERVRAITKIEDSVSLIVLNIPEQKKTIGKDVKLDNDGISAFISDYIAGKLKAEELG